MKQPSDFYPDCPTAMLVSLARDGDNAAFSELVARHQSPLRAMLRRMSGDNTLADDLAQQTLLQAFTQIRHLKQEAAFSGWLRKIGVNTWLQHCRKHDLLNNVSEVQEQAHPTTDAGLVVDLNTALLLLKPLERLCLTLNYQEGMSHGEISEAAAMPLGTVKSHIKRGAEKLHGILKAYRDD